ncbi:MAG: DUF5916 domain-containing protein [Candidatus Aminicenantes bacterium]
MSKRLLVVIVITFIMLLTGYFSWSVELSEDDKIIKADQVSETITIDGELDEAIWKQLPIKRAFETILPTFGNPLPVDTIIWTAYDKENLYFAFRCLDKNPGKIKNTLSPRDKISTDDYVGFALDSLSSKQNSYEFYSNPSGIQFDAINSSVGGWDSTADFVWHSAGKLIPQGYQVEIRIPLESIRYKSGEEVKMGVIFMRNVPHLGSLGSWPAHKGGGELEFNFMTTIVYKNLKSKLKMEILPNITYSNNSRRLEADNWEKSTDTNIGVGIKYGITSAITAEATVNPDFSQVESDAFQVEVNQRYPIFYSEKRPFFMETKEILDFTVITESMLPSPIHTRNIVDPGWAVKFSGATGKMNFGILAANDRSPGRVWEEGVNPHEGKTALFGIVRAKYNIGSDNSLGVLYAGRRFSSAGERNDVGGLDLKYRFARDLRASLSYLHTVTGEAEGEPLKKGDGFNAMMEYYSPRLLVWGTFERYDRDFFMATAFRKRVGISRWAVGVSPIFDMKIKQLPWLKRIIVFFHYYHIYDLQTRMTDTRREYALNFGFAPRGELYLQYWHDKEAWAGQLLDKKYLLSWGYIQLFKWLYLYEYITIGDQIYYDPTNPFVGSGKNIQLGIKLEPGIKLKLSFDYTRSDLKEKQGNSEVYAVNIYNFNASYQFNKYFFLRGILRYDDLQEKLLTDVLASFTLIPGTVVHLGYGSLHLQNQWQNNMWVPGQGDLIKMKQGIFFKASYLWRIK